MNDFARATIGLSGDNDSDGGSKKDGEWGVEGGTVGRREAI